MTESMRAVGLIRAAGCEDVRVSPRRHKIPRTLTTTTCECGHAFTYAKGSVPRRLCDRCLVQRRSERSKASKNEQRDRSRDLPKVWKQDQRRAYTAAEGHLDKALVQILELTPEVKRDLLMRFMASISDEAPRRKMPPRNPQSD